MLQQLHISKGLWFLTLRTDLVVEPCDVMLLMGTLLAMSLR